MPNQKTISKGYQERITWKAEFEGLKEAVKPESKGCLEIPYQKVILKGSLSDYLDFYLGLWT